MPPTPEIITPSSVEWIHTITAQIDWDKFAVYADERVTGGSNGTKFVQQIKCYLEQRHECRLALDVEVVENSSRMMIYPPTTEHDAIYPAACAAALIIDSVVGSDALHYRTMSLLWMLRFAIVKPDALLSLMSFSEWALRKDSDNDVFYAVYSTLLCCRLLLSSHRRLQELFMTRSIDGKSISDPMSPSLLSIETSMSRTTWKDLASHCGLAANDLHFFVWVLQEVVAGRDFRGCGILLAALARHGVQKPCPDSCGP